MRDENKIFKDKLNTTCSDDVTQLNTIYDYYVISWYMNCFCINYNKKVGASDLKQVVSVTYAS